MNSRIRLVADLRRAVFGSEEQTYTSSALESIAAMQYVRCESVPLDRGQPVLAGKRGILPLQRVREWVFQRPLLAESIYHLSLRLRGVNRHQWHKVSATHWEGAREPSPYLRYAGWRRT
jgi:hypothetical protein